MKEQFIRTEVQAPYYTYGTKHAGTRQVWLVCHGYGQLARYFLRRFDGLSPQHHYVIAPEGLSRFYLDPAYKKVGASWMTREHREKEIESQWTLLDRIWEAETRDIDLGEVQVTLMGFSQGVSTISRWAISRQCLFDRLLLWAGRFPPEIDRTQTAFVKAEAQVVAIVGEEDPLVGPEAWEAEKTKLTHLFPTQLSVHTFAGGHEVPREEIRCFDDPQ